MNTSNLIDELSKEAAKPALRGPRHYAYQLGLVLVLYAVIVVPMQGLRPDLAMQLTRPLFLAEVMVLAALVAASMLAAVLSMYPDSYQKHGLLRLPYVFFCVLAVFIAGQGFLPLDARMVMPQPGAYTIECSICIAALTLVPSALIFRVLRKGASVKPWRAGSFAVLASSALGCLMLRLAEDNDSLTHLAQWHYLPTLIFAALGALAGKYLLRW